MPDIESITELRSLIGSSAFLPSILAYLRNSSSGNLPLDPGIFQAILQCMVAGDKHLILLAPEEDVSLVVKLAVWTLLTIFDLPAHKAKIRSRTTPTPQYKDLTPQNPNLFLRSLFLPSHRSDGGDLPKLSCHTKSRLNKRHSSLMRPASAPNVPHHSNKLSAGASYNNSTSDSIADSAPPPLIIAAPQPRPFVRANTDPFPLFHTEEPEFPHAVVLHGLERASVAEQTALADALTRRQVLFEPVQNVAKLSARRMPSRKHNGGDLNNLTSEDTGYQGTWNIPDDFILISVCAWNSKERPKIHRSMLDLFAMSSTIYVQKPIRDAWKALPFTVNTLSQSRMQTSHSNPSTPTPPQSRTSPISSQGFHNAARHPSSRFPLAQEVPIAPRQLIPRNFIVFLQKAAQSAYVSSQLSLYMSDLFSAVRHHPKLDGTFLTTKSMNDANDLARAGRVLGIDPTGGELLNYFPTTEFDNDKNSVRGQTSSEMHGYIVSGSESITLDVNVPRASASLGSAKGHETTSASVSRPVSGPLFVSEAAIARVVPRVVSHRLRVRDGPLDEVLAGAAFGATSGPIGKEAFGIVGYGWNTRSTVKDILVEILAEV